MGQNKALMPFHGVPLIQRVISRLISLANEMNVIADEVDTYKFLGLPVVPDQIPGRGVLGGIFTGFSVSNNPFVAPVGCDLPFVSSQLFAAELQLIRDSEFDVVIPESQNGLEPLHAVYRRDACLPLVKRSLLDGDNRIISWFGSARVKELTQCEIKRIDPDPRIFLNLNRPEEYAQASALPDDV